jgi:hypothetical protein
MKNKYGLTDGNKLYIMGVGFWTAAIIRGDLLIALLAILCQGYGTYLDEREKK